LSANTADIAIKGGVLVNSQEMKRADIFIKNGRVDTIEPAGSDRSASTVIEAAGQFVLPGIIDAHLHPVYADRIDTLSKAAAFGGITTLIPFIGAIKAWGKEGTLFDAVKDLIAEGEENSYVDFGIHCSLCHDDLETIASVLPKVIELGVISFKGFMAFAKRGMKLEDDEHMQIMEIIAQNGGLYAVHAENGTLVDYLQDRFIAQGNHGPEFYGPSQPNIAEAEAVFRILSLAQVIKCPMYLVHLSARESLDVVRLFKEWGEPKFYSETCTHYLTLTGAEMKKRGSLAKVGPPLREQQDIEAMWQAVDQGLIDVIGSDTAGHMVEAKEPLMDEVFKAPSGIPGQEEMFTVTYDEGINKGRTTLPRLVRLMCENPAKIFGLYPRKGVLQPGSDADVVIFDPTLSYTVKAKDLHTQVDYSMYEGRECLGAPVTVLQRGNILIEDGKFLAKPGQSQYLPGNTN
jgi:dihydropyrimidinase